MLCVTYSTLSSYAKITIEVGAFSLIYYEVTLEAVKRMGDDDTIRANFQPSDTNLLKSGANNQLLIENPILSSVLSKAFPYLLLFDNVLEIITWTNDDTYSNFLILIGYSILVLYWKYVSLIILPILMSLTFAYIIWSVNSIVFDTKYNEKPTIDEIIYTLHNITVRFEMLFRPFKKHDLKWKNYVRILFVTGLLTPIHIAITKYIIHPQRFIWLTGLFLLSYHSSWSWSIRKLLWRSVYVRILVFYLTGLNIQLIQNNDGKETNYSFDNILTDFKIIDKKIESPTKLRQRVRFEILENERRWVGLGWSKFLLPNERSAYCFENSFLPIPNLKDFEFPVFENDLYNYNWEWCDNNWTLDKEFNKGKLEGWRYCDNNWDNYEFIDGFSKFTRTRKWIRQATLVIDKKVHVYDE